MGYFANGFVFTSEPDYKAVVATVPGRSIQGYKHNKTNLWLLDIWKPRGKLRRHSPFCDPAADGFRRDAASLDGPTRTFLEAFQRLIDILGHSPCPEPGYVQLALAVSAAASRPAFFFAADDEELDMGCRTQPGSLSSFGCRFDRLSVRYGRGGRITVTPLHHVEDCDDDEFEELIATARQVAGITVEEPHNVEGGKVLYEHPIQQWPTEAGNPETILGLGTWDLLTNVETDFTVVFEQTAQ